MMPRARLLYGRRSGRQMMRTLALFGWLLAKILFWEDMAGEDRYVVVDQGWVEVQDGNAGGGPP